MRLDELFRAEINPQRGTHVGATWDLSGCSRHHALIENQTTLRTRTSSTRLLSESSEASSPSAAKRPRSGGGTIVNIENQRRIPRARRPAAEHRAAHLRISSSRR